MLCITNNSFKHQSFVYTELNDQIVLFRTIQFCISYLFAHSLNVSEDLGAKVMKRYSIFPRSPLTRAYPSDCLISYREHLWERGGSYSSAEMQSVCSTATADWASNTWNHLTVCKHELWLILKWHYLQTICSQVIIIYQDLALNNLQVLICHKI